MNIIVKEYFNRIVTNKKIMRILWVVCLILFFILLSKYIKNKPAKFNYNNGVKKFREGDYELAEQYFGNVLYYDHSKKLECKTRINRALAIVTPITPESVNAENLDSSIELLISARDYLTENDCAHANDTNGHNKKAQKLKEEIDEYIEFLKEQNKEPEEDKKNNQEDEKTEEEKKKEEEERKKQEEEERKRKEEERQLKEKFNQIEQEGLAERNEDLDMYKAFESDDVYYSGKSW